MGFKFRISIQSLTSIFRKKHEDTAEDDTKTVPESSINLPPEPVPKTVHRSVPTNAKISIPPTNIQVAINRVDEGIELIDEDLNDVELTESRREQRTSQKRTLESVKQDLEIVHIYEKSKEPTEETAKKTSKKNIFRRSIRRVSKRLRKKNKTPKGEESKEIQRRNDELENSEKEIHNTIRKAEKVSKEANELLKSYESLHTAIVQESKKS